MPISHSRTAQNAMIQKIHVARRSLALEEESYRSILTRVTGKSSCKDMSDRELDAVLTEFKRLGFTPTKKRAGTRKPAGSAEAGKIRALWLDLYHIGEIRDPSENALAHFAKRTVGVHALQWITGKQADDVIKALRGWLLRVGLVNPTKDYVDFLRHSRRDIDHGVAGDIDYGPIAWKVAVLKRQFRLLELNLDLEEAALTPLDRLDSLIESLGISVRARKEALRERD